jgi:hypothetical protein
MEKQNQTINGLPINRSLKSVWPACVTLCHYRFMAKCGLGVMSATRNGGSAKWFGGRCEEDLVT